MCVCVLQFAVLTLVLTENRDFDSPADDGDRKPDDSKTSVCVLSSAQPPFLRS